MARQCSLQALVLVIEHCDYIYTTYHAAIRPQRERGLLSPNTIELRERDWPLSTSNFVRGNRTRHLPFYCSISLPPRARGWNRRADCPAIGALNRECSGCTICDRSPQNGHGFSIGTVSSFSIFCSPVVVDQRICLIWPSPAKSCRPLYQVGSRHCVSAACRTRGAECLVISSASQITGMSSGGIDFALQNSIYSNTNQNPRNSSRMNNILKNGPGLE